MAQAIADPHQLLLRLQLDPEQFPHWQAAHSRFRTRVPESYLARMRPGDPNDPLLLQVLPRGAELLEFPGFLRDPVGDTQAMVAPGILQKYAGRVLWITTGACAVHCRYCFRRDFPYSDFSAVQDWSPGLDYLAQHPDIHEVILSGGDPLTLADRRLLELVEQLERIPHLRRLRIHSRLPIVLPERVDDGLFQWLGQGRLHMILVLHANHPREFLGAAETALQRLRTLPITVLNQSVLLAGINDQVETLCALQETGFHLGVLPYYLHLLDRARGVGHFEVPEERAQALHAAMRARLPGYLVPRLVREEAGAPAKTLREASLPTMDAAERTGTPPA